MRFRCFFSFFSFQRRFSLFFSIAHHILPTETQITLKITLIFKNCVFTHRNVILHERFFQFGEDIFMNIHKKGSNSSDCKVCYILFLCCQCGNEMRNVCNIHKCIRESDREKKREIKRDRDNEGTSNRMLANEQHSPMPMQNETFVYCLSTCFSFITRCINHGFCHLKYMNRYYNVAGRIKKYIHTHTDTHAQKKTK